MTDIDVSAALPDWTDVRAERVGPLWVVSGVDPASTPRSGARDDLDSLLADLAAQGREPVANEPVLDSDSWPDGLHASALDETAIEPVAAPELELEPKPEPEPMSFEQLAQAGIMLMEDELTIRRGVAIARISEHADALIANAVDPNRRTEFAAEVAVIWNKRQMGIDLTAEEQAVEAEHAALSAWEGRVRAFERALRDAVRQASLDMVREIDVDGAGWPQR